MTATSLCSDTRRFDLDFLDDDELQLVCDETAVKLPSDAGDRGNRTDRTIASVSFG